MKVSIELALRTREVYQLFERRINGNQQFIGAILHKFNIILDRCRRNEPDALALFNQMEQRIVALTQQYINDTARFETLLAKKNAFVNLKLSYIIQFRPVITVTNRLALNLIEFVEVYDKLIALLKMLHLAGCFEADNDFFNNIKRYQKIANKILSSLMLAPATTKANNNSHASPGATQ